MPRDSHERRAFIESPAQRRERAAANRRWLLESQIAEQQQRHDDAVDTAGEHSPAAVKARARLRTLRRVL